MVSKAFQGVSRVINFIETSFQCLLILVSTDSQKRTAYDRSGGDPEDRFGGGGMSSFFNQGNGRAGADGEINPEELFNMFFGGGGLGGGFGGPGTTFSFGPGGPGWWLSAIT